MRLDQSVRISTQDFGAMRPCFFSQERIFSLVRRKSGLEADSSEQSITEALGLYREIGDRRGEAWSIQQMAWISFMEDRPEEADERLRLAERTFTELSDAGGLAWVRGLSAYVRFQQGDLDEARSLYQQSIDIEWKLGDQNGIASSLHQLGQLAENEGDKVEAARMFREALTIFERLRSTNAEIARRSLERVEGRDEG